MSEINIHKFYYNFKTLTPYGGTSSKQWGKLLRHELDDEVM